MKRSHWHVAVSVGLALLLRSAAAVPTLPHVFLMFLALGLVAAGYRHLRCLTRAH